MQNNNSLALVLQHYPFDNVDLLATLPAEHWFNQHFLLLTRTPYRHELFSAEPPRGLLRRDSGNDGGEQDGGLDEDEMVADYDTSDEVSGKPLLEHHRSSYQRLIKTSPVTTVITNF
ncbi:hypothetical protein QFC19_000002 [Naganishia cerealis]|uniref:Uncharacterized protein n=1 Tax=Naganishia cerealis TaxID=610337 RepID=A0ACC2WRK1_9TREE|nr:hypothetical protein QFC19_000002 [Naganishia cerealis]